ncbi:RagB/SusD family nutrient uptake outer membrane protein [Puia dinghuensis]|uniref:Membrane protein n=1 Tax=Puia dinghuensis TaxID=1792502 RepID=A0A8J2XR92_9BACT|nr:RagB/SusD family nutrient uptake outer membrane protein [Puia dinghuensis]GGA88115.1 membrane protein [Puia dinghuensis]
MKIVKFLGLSALVFSSCSKQLNITPTDQVDAHTVFSSVGSLNQGVAGVYANWREEYLIRIGSVVADECRIGLQNTGVSLTDAGQNLFRWAFTGTTSEIAEPWANGYQVINEVNLILAGIDGVPAKSAADALEKQQLKGELLAIRAFQHFDLYRVYAYSGVYDPTAYAVPYVTGTNIYEEPSRPQAGAFFTTLKQDMAAAEGLIGNSGALNRMGLTALYALEARVALYTSDWPTAIDRAGKVIAAVPLAPATNFPGIWTDNSTAEVIFKLSRTNQSGLRPGDCWYNIPYGVYLFAPSRTLMSLYDTTNDIRYHSYFATDSSLVATGQLPDIISKYAGSSGAQNLNDLKVFRTGEQYLILAEAYARSGNLAAAAADLNTLRGQRIAGYQPVSFVGAADLLAAVFAERYKELCYEGHRLYDLKRAGMNVVRQPVDWPQGAAAGKLTPSSLYYYIPIPQAEVLANPHIAPNNPGW